METPQPRSHPGAPGAVWDLEPSPPNPLPEPMDPGLPPVTFQAWCLANLQGDMVPGPSPPQVRREPLLQASALVTETRPPGHLAGRRGLGLPSHPKAGSLPHCGLTALTVSLGRFSALLGFISRVANLEVPSCQGQRWDQRGFLLSPLSPPGDLTSGLGRWYKHWAHLGGAVHGTPILPFLPHHLPSRWAPWVTPPPFPREEMEFSMPPA